MGLTGGLQGRGRTSAYGEWFRLSHGDGREGLRKRFAGMMKAVWEQGGATLSIGIVTDERVQEFIDAHSDALNSSFVDTRMSVKMRERLERSTWIFSGMKAIREMGEAFPSLVDENGERKPFERFLNDVRRVDETYNEHYLKAEYEFAASSAQMAAKWEGFVADGDRYNLQYRTAGDDRVRPEHAALDGVTLPVSDPFWDSYYPPNGWRCRCDVVQVRKSKYPETPHEEAMALGESATGGVSGIQFRFNPGKQERVFPAVNGYTSSKCSGCEYGGGGAATMLQHSVTDGGGTVELSAAPVSRLCEGCRLVRQCYEGKTKRSEYERKEQNRKLYDRLSKDKRYKNVEFNPENGGLKATHRGHNEGSDDGFVFEKKLVDKLYSCGHSVILCDEQKKDHTGKIMASLDMILDGVRMDIKSITKIKDFYGSALYRKNDQLNRYYARTDVHVRAETVCLYFDDASMFAPDKISRGYEYAVSLATQNGEEIALHHVICAINSAKGLELKTYDFP